MPEELKFPLEFTACPVCGSTRKLAEELVKQEQEKGKIGADANPFLFQQQTLIMDPRKVILSFPVLISFYDVCLGTDDKPCGTVYCVHTELVQGAPQMKQPPPSGNMRQFGFPQNNPRMS